MKADKAWINGSIVISRPLEEVFDFVCDERNEPSYNPSMVRADKITSGPIGKGTQFRSAVMSMGRQVEMQTEYTQYERPVALTSTTTMRQGIFDYALTFEPDAAGTRMRWSARVRLKGRARLLRPLAIWLGRRQEQRIWTSLKRHLETTASQDRWKQCSPTTTTRSG
jgi:polyketide cyclase/dehydrase/lipid transport protein